MPITESFPRDANNVPITTDGLISTDAQVTTGTTASSPFNIPIFGITGTIEVRGLWGIVTTALGVNHTASAFRINDQTSQIYLTAVGGTDISAAPVGSLIIKNVLVATAITLKSSVAGAILEPASVNHQIHSPIILVQKTGGVATNIEYHYATTDAPTTGAFKFFLRWLPISSDGNVKAL